MLSFRKKILLSYALVFILFLTLLFPFATHSVKTIVYKMFKQQVVALIAHISSEPTQEQLIHQLAVRQQHLFFRVTLFTEEGGVLYDSSPEEMTQPSKPLPAEIAHALGGSTGYQEEITSKAGFPVIYVAKAFLFQGRTLVLRAAFPFKQFDELIRDFEVGILGVGSLLLLLFAILTWIIMNHLTKPIQRIIEVIRPYQEGKQDTLPQISLGRANELVKDNEFGALALTLNSLSQKIQKQIDTLTFERNNQELILESLGEGIVAVDSTLCVTYANRFALELLGMGKEELSHFDKTHLASCRELLVQCQHKHTTLTSSFKLPETGRFLEVLAVPMSRQNGAVLVVQDKSSHYKLQEVGKDFVANASHELKTPITIIRGFAETLHDHPDLPKEVASDIITKIVRNCERMETLVRNLLILADVEKLPYSRLQECDIESLLENCKQMIVEVYPSAQIAITIVADAPEHIVADPDLLELAIMNLMSNAAKYSDPPAKIAIKVYPVSPEKVAVSIQDHGIGIPKEDIGHIFDRFYTVNKAHSRKLGGSGLGLSITKTIIDKHKGSIVVHSQLAFGSTFTITLPVFLMDLNA